jgi:hypothetical protein
VFEEKLPTMSRQSISALLTPVCFAAILTGLVLLPCIIESTSRLIQTTGGTPLLQAMGTNLFVIFPSMAIFYQSTDSSPSRYIRELSALSIIGFGVIFYQTKAPLSSIVLGVAFTILHLVALG